MKKHLSIWLLLLTLTSVQALQVEEMKIEGLACVKIENSFYRLLIIPDKGAQIFQWLNKVSNVAYVDVKFPEVPGSPIPSRGLLDDRGRFWVMPYDLNSRKI